jgi:serine palmitoyltransferase
MGTFTKSFGGMGGYISSSKLICDHLREQCPAYVYHNTLSPVVAQQVPFGIYIYIYRD